MILTTWLMGCADEAAQCKSGFTAGADGLCYEIAGPDTRPDDTLTEPPDDTGPGGGAPSVDDVLADLPPCTSDPSGDGSIDLVAGCASGVCVGDLPEVVFDVLGEPDVCLPLDVDFGVYGGYALLLCDWSNFVSISFMDEDRDGVADPDLPIDSIDLDMFYQGATTDGLGLGDEPSCFVGSYAPRDASFESDGRSWFLTSARFTTFAVYDWSDRSGGFGSDGKVDALTLYGP